MTIATTNPKLAPIASPAGILTPSPALLDRAPAAQPASPRSADRGASVAIEAVVLLGGSVRRNELVDATCRSRLDLPLDDDGTVLNQWQRQVSQWLRVSETGRKPLRVVLDNMFSVSPKSAVADQLAPLHIERDPQDCRGTGGLLRDLAADYDDDHWLLVATAAQLLLEPLEDMVQRLTAIKGDVRILAHADGTPVSLMLVRCGCLRVIDRVGFVDLKEQGLRRIARTHLVGVAMSQQPTAMPLVTARDYLRAMRQHHLRRFNPHLLHDPFAEDWRCGFGVVEQPGQLDASVHLHDSVVLQGAQIGKGATIVRSLVCGGAVVESGKVVMDQLVRATRP